MKGAAVAADAALCGWFVLAALAFWGPQAPGWPLPPLAPNVGAALYGGFVVLFVATLALRLLRGGGGGKDGGGNGRERNDEQ